ncbi:hypothetical protein B0H19DRAFT_569115 [Mycena capillaripes]|nr:hypothetical protein B0H19DRAFT_569115 [Mycena capillaripes]
MDEVSFVPASHRTIDDDGDGSRRVPSLDRSLSTSSHGAYSGYSGGSYGGYARPPLSVQQQQHYYNYGPTPPEQYAPSEYMYSNTGAGAVSAVRRAPPGQIGESPIVQPPRARVARAQSTYSNSGLAHRPSQTATVQLTDPSPPPARDYLSNYTSPPTSGESVSLGPTTDIPLSPPLPNPYGGEEESHRRVLKVANE